MLQKLCGAGTLAEGEAERLMRAILDGHVPEEQIGTIRSLGYARREMVPVLVGFARAVQERALRIEAPCGRVVDMGSLQGDDRAPVFTLAALVLATSGVRVAPQGDSSASEPLGAVDVLAALGVRLELTGPAWRDCLRQTGFAFVHLPRHHPALQPFSAPGRRQQEFALFDLVRRLTHPAGATHRLLGVSDAAWLPLLADVLRRLGWWEAFVVCGAEGLDAVSPAGPTTVRTLRRGRTDRLTWEPEAAGRRRKAFPEQTAGDAEGFLARARSVLQGEPGGFFDAVCLNAGAALHLVGVAKDLWTGVQDARLLLESGQVKKKLEEIVDFTHRVRE